MPPGDKFHCNVRANFARAFSAWRRQANIPLKKIAGDLGVSISTVNSWEFGENFPGGENIENLVEYTGLPPCRLFCVMAEQCNMSTGCILGQQEVSLPGHRKTPQAVKSHI